MTNEEETPSFRELLKIVFFFVILPLSPLLVADFYYTYYKKEWPR